MNVYRLRTVGGPLLVDATATRRRLQALNAIGWPWRHLAVEMGTHLSWPHQLARSERVSRETEAAVLAVYERLQDTPGPDLRSVRSAQRHGWPTPAWWDEDTIGDPSYDPVAVAAAEPAGVDEVLVARACRGKAAWSELSHEEQDVVLLWLHDEQVNDGQAAELLSCSVRTLGRRRAAIGLPPADPSTYTSWCRKTAPASARAS